MFRLFVLNRSPHVISVNTRKMSFEEHHRLPSILISVFGSKRISFSTWLVSNYGCSSSNHQHLCTASVRGHVAKRPSPEAAASTEDIAFFALFLVRASVACQWCHQSEGHWAYWSQDKPVILPMPQDLVVVGDYAAHGSYCEDGISQPWDQKHGKN